MMPVLNLAALMSIFGLLACCAKLEPKQELRRDHENTTDSVENTSRQSNAAKAATDATQNQDDGTSPATDDSNPPLKNAAKEPQEEQTPLEYPPDPATCADSGATCVRTSADIVKLLPNSCHVAAGDKIIDSNICLAGECGSSCAPIQCVNGREFATCAARCAPLRYFMEPCASVDSRPK